MSSLTILSKTISSQADYLALLITELLLCQIIQIIFYQHNVPADT